MEKRVNIVDKISGENVGAQALYATLGFVERARLPLVVVERSSET